MSLYYVTSIKQDFDFFLTLDYNKKSSFYIFFFIYTNIFLYSIILNDFL